MRNLKILQVSRLRYVRTTINLVLNKVGLKKKKYRPDWAEAKVSKDAIIEGNPENIRLGMGTVINAGSVLSTKHGGSIRLGKGCNIHRGAMIMTYGGDITIGDHCTVNPYTILYGHGGLKVGNFVRIAAQCVVIPANHSFESTEIPISLQKEAKKGIEIGDDVWIASGVHILDGVQIGRGAVIGAGAVVVNNIPAFSVNVGVPARMIKMRK